MPSTEKGDLLTSIEDARPENVLVWGLAGAGFAISTGDELVYIDPYLSVPDPSRPFHRAVPVPFPPDRVRSATAVVSTHEHNDHCDPATLRAFAKNTVADFFGPSTSAKKAIASGYPQSRVRTVKPGDSLRISHAFGLNVFPSNDPYETGAVTYVFQTPRGSIFHSGDTSYFDGFREVGSRFSIDVALLNFGKQIPDFSKPYYMDAHSVAKASRDLRAKTTVPMHWNLWLEGKDDPSKVEAELKIVSPGTGFRVVDVGEFLEL
jgi:L-ascorbate metabolism protein UlaG (beta-lactamase superfamily)